MRLRFKLQTSGFMEWHNSHPHGVSEECHYVSWVLRVSYDEENGLTFERGYTDRWNGNHVKPSEIESLECQRRRVFKLSSSDPRLSSFAAWLNQSGVLGWDLCADIMPKAEAWHVWRFSLEMDGCAVEWAMGMRGAPLPSFDAFKGFKFQDGRDFESNHPRYFSIFQHLKNSPEPVDLLGLSAWGEYDNYIANGYWFLPPESHFYFCHADPRLVELTRRVFDLLESRSLPQVISYRDTDGRMLSVDFARRRVKVANRWQSREVTISEATLNAFWKNLDGRNYGQPATNDKHWPNWQINHATSTTPDDYPHDPFKVGCLWHAELCDGHDRWAGIGHVTPSWRDQEKLVQKFRFFDGLLSIEDEPNET